MSRSGLALALAALVSSGCTVLERLHSGSADARQPAAIPETAGIRTVLARAREFAALPAAQRDEALAHAARHYAREDPPLSDTLHYALLLAMTETASAKLVEVKEALRRGLTEQREDHPLAPLAAVLIQMLDRRTQLRQENADLRTKLEQLKTIEQNLREREGPDGLPINQ